MSRLAPTFLITLLVCIVSSRSFAQEHRQDSTAAPSDSATASNATALSYSADSITYDVEDSTLVLNGHASITYGAVSVKAGRILFDTRREVLTAEAIIDSSGEAPKADQLPILKDAQGTLTGERMIYGIKTRQGRIFRGRTQYGPDLISGAELRVDGESTIRVENGIFTTCDLPEHKHYWLSAKQVKITPNDKAVIKNVVGHVYGIPVFYLPFYVVPLKKGRRSGLTKPTYGSGAVEGTYVRDLGYYWAPSELWDLKVTGDVMSKQGMLLRPRLRYVKGRRLRGELRGSYAYDYDLTTNGWDIEGNHWQQLRPDLRISGRAEFANSLSYVRSTTRGIDPGRLQRSLRSNLSVDKTWGRNSMNLSVTESSPDGGLVRPATTLNFRLPTRSLVPPPKHRRSTGGVPDMNPAPSREPSRLQSVLYGYNVRLQDQRLNAATTRQEVAHRLNVSAQQTLGGWLKVQPTGTYTENWIRRTDTGFDRNVAYTAGLLTSATLYGTFQPKIGRLRAVRHVMTPSLSFTQSGPDNVTRFLNFRLSNILQAKTVSDGKEHKHDLMFVNFSTGYNFKAKTRPLSDLFTSIRIPNRGVNVDASLTHDFYRPVVNTFRFPWLKRATITTSINFRGRRERATSSSGPSGASEAEALPGGAPGRRGYDGLQGIGRDTGRFVDNRFNEQFNRILGPWSVALTHRYSVTRSTPSRGFRTATHLITASNRFDMDRVTDPLHISNRFTHPWRVGHTINYDINRRKVISQNFNLHRNLHRWELFVRWTPNGFNKGIFFRLNIIAHPEIKIEQQRLSR